jgi:hypothetical protein
MGFFASLLKGKQPNKVTPFEAFLRAFTDDPHLADKMIRDAKPSNRLMMAFCLACLHGGYTITAEIRHSLESLPALPSASPPNFQFDAVAQEVIAFVFFTVMAEHLEAEDEAEDEPEGEQLRALKEARYLAESLTAKYTTAQPTEYIKNRLLIYSLAAHKKKNLFEEASNKIIAATSSGKSGASIDSIVAFAAVQHALASDMLLAIKDGISVLYANWRSNPNSFGT